MNQTRIAVLVSGGGTNLQALIDAQSRGELAGGQIVAVISSKEGAYALERAAKAGIEGYTLPRKQFDSNRAMTQSLVTLLKELDIQLVVLGTGEEQYENMFRHYDWKYSNKVSANIFYSDALSHKIYASCDAFLMPSLFEPCGLSQLMALRYGTLPIVRETGGLKDTVEPYNEYEGTGTGFSFTNYNAHDMLHTIRYAEHIYYKKKREWNKIVDRAMTADFSWNASANKYQEMYDVLIG
jgi:glycogen synthase